MQFTGNINSSRWPFTASQKLVNRGAQFCKIGTIWSSIEMRQKINGNENNN